MSAMPRSHAAPRKLRSNDRRSHRVEIANRFRGRKIDLRQLRKAVVAVLDSEKIAEANISLAVIDDQTIAELNDRFLDHQGPTDVISFALEDQSPTSKATIDGEIIVSAETAIRAAKDFGTSMALELLLYVIHGTLHLVGYDDLSAAERKIMRQKEQFYLAQFGMPPVADRSTAASPHAKSRRKAMKNEGKSRTRR
jgi:probable rRNA maturation factor